MRRVQILLLTGLVAMSVAASAMAQARIPASVMAHLQGLEVRCKAAGGQPGGGRFIVAQDFTGDGRPDYLISEGDYLCSGRPNLFRSNGEARVDIFVADASGQARRVFSDVLIGFRVVAGTPPKVQIARRGAACGPAAGAATQCASQLAWNGQAFGAGVSVSSGDRPPTPSVTPSAPPSAVAAGGPPTGEGEGAFVASCRRDLIARDAGAARWADEECRSRWSHVQAATPAADALLAALPTPGSRPSVAELKARMAGVRWMAQAPRGRLAAGRLGSLEVFIEGNGATPSSVGVAWGAVGAEIPYDVAGALRLRGGRLIESACEKMGAGEGERRFAGTLPGRAPFALTVSQRTAPTANAQSYYAAAVSLDGRHPARGDTSGCDF